MPRAILPESCLHSAIRERIDGYQQSILMEVMDAVATRDVVAGIATSGGPRRPASPQRR